MVVAVIAVRVVQAAIDQVVGVIAMGHGRVAAIRPMFVPGLTADVRDFRTARRVFITHLNDMLVIVSDFPIHLMRVMQMPIVQVIHVAIVAHRQMAAARAVGVIVRCVRLAVSGHGEIPFSG